ncbi:NADPH-dependent 7-cyano-7-deazaguanine reductase QueF [Gynuella sp.]|uniref:NADPH-dependent 7-cyano-7-deazaguanine reductase QueF n=1 Tax=Gynuella sp. TaxID=2969146 RepID=UPI003D1482F6
MADLTDAPLGKTSLYTDQYDPSLLFPIARANNRSTLNVEASELTFHGYDVWNAWELSWLNNKGKPVVAVGQFTIPAQSPCLIESKSLKLYLNSFNQTRFDDIGSVTATIEKDLSQAAGAEVKVNVLTLENALQPFGKIHTVEGSCVDELDVDIDVYSTADPQLLKISPDDVVSETLVSHLMKSNCPVTGQPDWGSVVVSYAGPRICPESFLRYVVSFRQHTEFHEHCVERMFLDILKLSQPTKLKVSARYVRRGGLDINPVRSMHPVTSDNLRLLRQ